MIEFWNWKMKAFFGDFDGIPLRLWVKFNNLPLFFCEVLRLLRH